MTVTIEKEDINELDNSYEVLCNKVIETCIDYMKCPYESEVNVLITTDEVIHAVNHEQRGIDKATDVLSFPMVEWEEIEDFDSLEDYITYFHPESGELILGDIVLSMDKVVGQAGEYGHSIEREFAFLITHSMLHLFGYDHMEEVERVDMEKAQSEIMEILGIPR